MGDLQWSNLQWAVDLFDDLPKDAVVTGAIALVSYVVMPEEDDDDDNGMRYSTIIASDAPLSSTIGLLEMFKTDLLEGRRQ